MVFDEEEVHVLSIYSYCGLSQGRYYYYYSTDLLNGDDVEVDSLDLMRGLQRSSNVIKKINDNKSPFLALTR